MAFILTTNLKKSISILWSKLKMKNIIMFSNNQPNKSYINNMENPTIIYYNITKTTDLRNEWVVIVIGNDFFTPYNDIYIINTIYISYYVG
jgi:hypothetical protein